MHDLVAADLVERKGFGLKKYGRHLQAFNGREPLVDAYQEVLDLSVYLRQEIIERRDFEANLGARLQALVDGAASICAYCLAILPVPATEGDRASHVAECSRHPMRGMAEALREARIEASRNREFLDELDSKMTGVRNALTEAGVPDVTPGGVFRSISTVERVEMLRAERDTLREEVATIRRRLDTIEADRRRGHV